MNRRKNDFDNEDIETDFSDIPSSLNNLFETDEDSMSKILNFMFNNEDLRTITDISPNKIIDITVLNSVATYFNNELISAFIDDILALSISKNRESRKELVRMQIGETYALDNVEEKRRGLLTRIGL